MCKACRLPLRKNGALLLTTITDKQCHLNKKLQLFFTYDNLHHPKTLE